LKDNFNCLRRCILQTYNMAPPTVPQDQTSALLPPKDVKDKPILPLSQATATNIKALAVLRIGLGAMCLAVPSLTLALFQFPLPQASNTIVRLWGIRDAILGELLYTAENRNVADGGRRELRRALWSNVAADAVDMCSAAFAVATGNMAMLPAAVLGGGAAMGVAMGAFGLRGL
jgi:hypothetical protein